MYLCKQYLMKCSKNGKISTQNQVENWVEHFTRAVEVKCHNKYINPKEGANFNNFQFQRRPTEKLEFVSLPALARRGAREADGWRPGAGGRKREDPGEDKQNKTKQ